MVRTLIVACVLVLLSCKEESGQVLAQKSEGKSVEQIEKSAEEWKKQLNDIEYYVLREEGTERAFTGDLWDHKGDGIYVCRGCALPLFDSNTKYKSGTGWPSYYAPYNDVNVATDTDYKIGYARTEVHCARCGGHLGHVFEDGPKPTGLRYCINSVSLDFVKRDSFSEETEK